jgi:uncharacterized damage-inducible protein DinB
MNNSLKAASITIITQLIELLQLLPDHTYTAPLPLLSGNTIGKHIRHIAEFYECVITGSHTGTVNYDARCRNTRLETDRLFCIEKLHHIAELSCSVSTEKKLNWQMSFSATTEPVKTESSLMRELAYAMEHAIHHMAIIKMAIKSIHLPIELPPDFGVAFSTVQYRAADGSARRTDG